MFDRISNGFALARSSWHVLIKDKHLLVFPFVSGFMFVLVLASFAVPMATLVDWGQVKDQMDRTGGKPPVWTYAVLFGFYFCTYFVTVFCNAALVSCTLLRFNGETPTVGDGFRAAMARLPQIFAWALVSATVGVALKAIESINEKVGYYVSLVLGTAWSIMTFFVVPVLVVEKTGPVQAVSRSVSLLKKTWGEAAVGKLGLGFVLFLLAIPVLALLLGGAYVASTGAVPLGVGLMIAGLIAGMLHMAVSAALHTILLGAIYQYATADRVPDGFDRGILAGAFAPKPA